MQINYIICNEADSRPLVVGFYDHPRNKPDVIRKGFEISGIVEAVTKELEPEDPFVDQVPDH